jgi:hypothetical protein
MQRRYAMRGDNYWPLLLTERLQQLLHHQWPIIWRPTA